MTSLPDEMLVPDFSQLRESCMPFGHALSLDFELTNAGAPRDGEDAEGAVAQRPFVL